MAFIFRTRQDGQDGQDGPTSPSMRSTSMPGPIKTGAEGLEIYWNGRYECRCRNTRNSAARGGVGGAPFGSDAVPSCARRSHTAPIGRARYHRVAHSVQPRAQSEILKRHRKVGTLTTLPEIAFELFLRLLASSGLVIYIFSENSLPLLLVSARTTRGVDKSTFWRRFFYGCGQSGRGREAHFEPGRMPARRWPARTAQPGEPGPRSGPRTASSGAGGGAHRHSPARGRARDARGASGAGGLGRGQQPGELKGRRPARRARLGAMPRRLISTS